VIDRCADCALDNLAETALDNIETANPTRSFLLPRRTLPDSGKRRSHPDPEIASIDRSIHQPWLSVFANVDPRIIPAHCLPLSPMKYAATQLRAPLPVSLAGCARGAGRGAGAGGGEGERPDKSPRRWWKNLGHVVIDLHSFRGKNTAVAVGSIHRSCR